MEINHWRIIRQCTYFLCRKTKIKRTANLLVISLFKLKLLWIFKTKTWSEHITNVHSLPKLPIPPHFSTQNWDMCHDIIGSGLIEIESQPDWNNSIQSQQASQLTTRHVIPISCTFTHSQLHIHALDTEPLKFKSIKNLRWCEVC